MSGSLHDEALRLLDRRSYTRARLVGALMRRGHGAGEVASCCDRLEASGLLNDRAFALEYARSIVAGRPAGRPYVVSRLVARGFRGADAEAAAEEALRGRDAVEDAVLVAEAHARRLPSCLERSALTRRVAGALARRGFDAEVCREAAERVSGGDG